MKKLILLSVLLFVLCGCQDRSQQQVGFLSDYSRLQQGHWMAFRNEPSPESLGKYTKFIVDPVQVHFYRDSNIGRSRLSDAEIKDLVSCMRQSTVNSLSDRYQIVDEPGADVARIRVALTDMKEARVIRKLIPGAKVSYSGKGTVAMEAEIVDSRSGEQLAATVETRVVNRRKRSRNGYTRPIDVEYSINKWSWRLRNSIDKAHGYEQCLWTY
jgi:hypothetical protein